MNDPDNPEHDDYMEWIGGEFDSEAFDLERVNSELKLISQGRKAEWQNVWPKPDEQQSQDLMTSANSWIGKITAKHQSIAENLPLRRDVVALLTYLRDNRVIGTQSTGNLSMKAVNDICATFVNPPKLEETIGEYTFRVRSESSVWPLFFRHLLACRAGLAIGGLGKRWHLTSLGQKFLVSPLSIQVWLLWVTWWTQIDWAIAFSYRLEVEFFPENFPALVLNRLQELSPETSTPFVRFADNLIEDAGLVWPIENQEFAMTILRSMVEITMIDPMIDFGVLEAKYSAEVTLGREHRELTDFQITTFGRGLSDALKGITTQNDSTRTRR